MFAGQGKPDGSVFTPSASTESEIHQGTALALRIYRASIDAYTDLLSRGVTPHVLIGHGFGEIAALVAGGAFSVSEGAELVVARCCALAHPATMRYCMTAIHASPAQVEALLRLLPSAAVSVAAENSSHESVIVGPLQAVWAVADLAAAVNLPVVQLRSDGAPHRPLPDERTTAMASTVRHIVQRPLHTPVFSPLRGRLYCDSDGLIDCFAEQLRTRIRFADAIAMMVRDGVSLVIECGPLRGLADHLDCETVSDTEFCRALVREIA
jgi:acyl transferase domain-containing protein